MSYAKVLSAALVGVGGHLVEVEAYLAPGIPGLSLVGLPDAALHEAGARVRAAIGNSGQEWPARRITVNLNPAYLRKHGSSFDLPIALALLGGTGQLPLAALSQVLVVGELGLDGAIRPVRGVLPMVAVAARHGLRDAIVPSVNGSEAALVPGVRVWTADRLHQVIEFIQGLEDLPESTPGEAGPPSAEFDMADVMGQAMGRYAVEVAAAGGHHLFLLGPPGTGKSMLAQRLPTILPELDDEAALEVTALHSIAGQLPPGSPLIRRPPLQMPHHTSTVASLVGGGGGLARPGALSLAHRGVLVLDEVPEFKSQALESLRQPLENGLITIGRSQGTVVYPARVQLVLTANPCPCGRPEGLNSCVCAPFTRSRYLGKLSGPLLDRIDIRIEVLPVSAAHLCTDLPAESSAVMAKRVAEARGTAGERWAGAGYRINSEVSGRVLRGAPWRLSAHATSDLRSQLEKGLISARGYDRVLRLAWTVADLAGQSHPGKDDVNIAYELRKQGPK